MSRLSKLQLSIKRFSTSKYTVRHNCALTFLNQMTHSEPDVDQVCTYRCSSCPSLIGGEDNLSDYMARLNLGRLDE